MGAGLHLGIPGAASGGRGPPPNPSLTISHLGACAGPGPGLCCGLGAGSIMVLWESLDWERDGLDVSHTRPFSWFSFFFHGFLLMEPCVEFLAPRARIKPVPPAVDPWNLNPRTSGAILSLLFSVSCFPRGKSR